MPRDVSDADLYASVSGKYRRLNFGMLVPYAQRSVARYEPTVQIPENVDAGSIVFLRAVLTYDGDVVRLHSPANILAEDAATRHVVVYPLLVLLSICAALGLANLVLFIVIRDRTRLYYAMMMGAAVLLGLTGRPGLGWALVWTNASVPMLPVAQVALLGYYTCIAIFSRRFLKLQDCHPWLGRAIGIALALYIAADILLQWLIPRTGLGRFGDILSSATDVLYFLVVWVVGVIVWRSGKTSARFYVVAISGVLFGLLVDVVSNFKIGEASILFPFMGIAWEGTMLFAALADDYVTLAREREQANVERVHAAEQRTAEIEYVALHDTLTGLANRRSIELALAALAEGDASAPCHALAYIDLDHFTVVNDTFGHIAGDQLLVTTAESLRGAVATGDSIARIGGDEFLVLMRDVRSMEDVNERAERLRDTLALMRMVWEGQTVPLSASIGVAVARAGAADPSALMSLADAACAVAKDSGRNRVHCVSDETTAARAKREMDWVGRITKALDENRMRLYAQSIVPLGKPQSGLRFEVLIRLVDGDNVVEPSAFLPAAERFGLMPQIDAWVIERALALCASAAHSGALRSLSVNLSGAFLRLGNAQRIIEDAIETAGFPPERLCLEITETVVATHLGDVIGLTRALGARGVRFALDDFGTGSSSLALLKRLRLDYVKIDGSFVRDCVSNRIDSAIIESVVRLAKLLQMRAVAEYVADSAIAGVLRELGVDYGQGWAFDKARPLEEVVALLAASGHKTAG